MVVSALPRLSTCLPMTAIRSYSSRPRSKTARALSDSAACCQAYCAVRSIVTSVVGVAMCTRRAIAYSSRPGSRSSAEVVTLLDHAHPDEIERSLYEADHVARAHRENFGAVRPASTLVQVAALTPATARVEIEVTAIIHH